MGRSSTDPSPAASPATTTAPHTEPPSALQLPQPAVAVAVGVSSVPPTAPAPAPAASTATALSPARAGAPAPVATPAAATSHAQESARSGQLPPPVPPSSTSSSSTTSTHAAVTSSPGRAGAPAAPPAHAAHKGSTDSMGDLEGMLDSPSLALDNVVSAPEPAVAPPATAPAPAPTASDFGIGFRAASTAADGEHDAPPTRALSRAEVLAATAAALEAPSGPSMQGTVKVRAKKGLLTSWNPYDAVLHGTELTLTPIAARGLGSMLAAKTSQISLSLAKDTNVQLMGEADFSVTAGDGEVVVCRAPDALVRDAWVRAVTKSIIALRETLRPSGQGRR